jgi:hypothetical protein
MPTATGLILALFGAGATLPIGGAPGWRCA